MKDGVYGRYRAEAGDVVGLPCPTDVVCVGLVGLECVAASVALSALCCLQPLVACGMPTRLSVLPHLFVGVERAWFRLKVACVIQPCSSDSNHSQKLDKTEMRFSGGGRGFERDAGRVRRARVGRINKGIQINAEAWTARCREDHSRPTHLP